MKNKEFKTLMAMITLTGTLLMSLTAGAAPVYAANTSAANKTTPEVTASQTTGGNTTADSASEKSTATHDTTFSGNTKPYKSETVYATIDSSGTIKNLTVSDQLKNISDTAQVTDKSNLLNIENVKGDETFSTKDGSLVWDTANADICYQGTSDKPLPVGVKVTYSLDGRQMTAEELTGKSGHLTIRYTYENNSASQNGSTTPFLMATGLLFDNASFKNITVTNGKLISDGEKEVAVGFGIPAISEMLGTNELDIPDYFEVEADVTDFTPVEGMTIATNSLFNDLETDSFSSLDELEASMSQLQSASSQLVEGSGELRNGLDTLLASSGTLTNGINQLANGSTTLTSGTQTLKNGAAELSGGLNTAASKVSGELLPGIQALDNGVAQMQGSLEEGLPQLTGGITNLKSGSTSLAEGTSALKAGLDQVGNGVTALSSGVAALAENTAVLSGGAAQVQDGATTLAGGIRSAADAASAMGFASYASDSWDEISALQSILDSGMITDENAIASLNTVIFNLSAEQSERDNTPAPDTASLSSLLYGLADSADTLSGAAGQVSEGTYALNTQFVEGGSLHDGVAGLYAALNPVDGAIALGAAQVQEGAATLDNGVSTLDSGIGTLSAQVTNGVARLKGGTSGLVAGIDGENGLAAGLNLLNSGAAQLASGTGELNTGAKTLADGIDSLQSGSGALIDGVSQLDNGAAQLNDGMIQFDRDGIQTLVNAFGGDVDKLLDTVNSLLTASKDYNNFSGIADGMDGEVKFIFVTE